MGERMKSMPSQASQGWQVVLVGCLQKRDVSEAVLKSPMGEASCHRQGQGIAVLQELTRIKTGTTENLSQTPAWAPEVIGYKACSPNARFLAAAPYPEQEPRVPRVPRL
ncbi:unnamed protein product, partial [Effrenium voratum]